MRKLWYFAFYGLCAFTIAFSLYWLAAVPALPRGAAPSSPGSSLPSARAGASAPGVPETPAAQEEGYYLESGNPLEYFSTEIEEAEIGEGTLILTMSDGSIQEYPMVDGMILLGSDILTITHEEGQGIAIAKDGIEPLVFRYGRR